MDERETYIASAPGASRFPKLTTFLAESTGLPAGVVVEALRLACEDNPLAPYEDADDEDDDVDADARASWSKAVQMANGQFGSEVSQDTGAADQAAGPWGQAVAAVNKSRGL